MECNCKVEHLGTRFPCDSWQSVEFNGSEAVPTCTISYCSPLRLRAQVGAFRRVIRSRRVFCKEVVVLVVEKFPLWWFTGVAVVNWFPCFLGEMEDLFDARGDSAPNFFFECACLGGPIASHKSEHACAVGVIVAI